MKTLYMYLLKNCGTITIVSALDSEAFCFYSNIGDEI